MKLNYNYQVSLEVDKLKDISDSLFYQYSTLSLLYGGGTKIISCRNSLSVANFLNLK